MNRARVQNFLLAVIAILLVGLFIGVVSIATKINSSSLGSTSERVSGVSTTIPPTNNPTVSISSPNSTKSVPNTQKSTPVTTATKQDYSYQIGWLNTLIKGANTYIDKDSKDLYGQAITTYDNCMKIWDDFEKSLTPGSMDYSFQLSTNRAKCKSDKDSMNFRIDGDVAYFKSRIKQYNYLLSRFQSGNPNQADIDMYAELVTKGR